MNQFMMKKDEVVAVAIDYQEKLLPAMKDADDLEEKVENMIEGLRVLNVPILVTQQYTKGLGETTRHISKALGDFTPIEKNTFSALKTEEFVEKLEKTGKKSVILMGIEAHICVQQTALELLEKGYNVFVIADCCSSRKKLDRKIAMARLESAGAVVTSYESALFELLDASKSEGFREISKIIK